MRRSSGSAPVFVSSATELQDRRRYLGESRSTLGSRHIGRRYGQALEETRHVGDSGGLSKPGKGGSIVATITHEEKTLAQLFGRQLPQLARRQRRALGLVVV